MKVAILGNLAGVAKEVVIALRERGIKADLYISNSDNDNTFRDMEGQQTLFKEYVHFIEPKAIGAGATVLHRLVHFFVRIGFQYRVVFKLLSYDVVHVHTAALNFSALSYLLFVKLRVKPYLAFATGSDIREVAQFDQSGRGRRTRNFFRNARNTLLLNNDMLSFAGALGIPHYEFFPFMINEDKHSARPNVHRPEKYHGKLLCFMMSNLDFGIQDSGVHRRALKRNDRFFKALSEFVKIDSNIHAIVLDRGADRLIARDLVRDLGLEKYVTFHPQMTELERIEHLNFSDVVIDQFDPGSFGLGALEALSIGKPLITYFRMDCVPKTYQDEIPILNAQTPEEILMRLFEARDSLLRAGIGRKARAWVLKHHSRKVVLHRLLNLYKKISIPQATKATTPPRA